MTQNQLAYWANQERVRSNLANEEIQRSRNTISKYEAHWKARNSAISNAINMIGTVFGTATRALASM